MRAQNRTTDEVINEISLREQGVVITKDSDFYHSHLLQGKPRKLVLARTGDILTRDLKAAFHTHLAVIVTALDQNSLVELDREAVRVVA